LAKPAVLAVMNGDTGEICWKMAQSAGQTGLIFDWLKAGIDTVGTSALNRSHEVVCGFCNHVHAGWVMERPHVSF